ncbi:MAG: hypothetical protein HYX95_03390 [Chloroflexi bacterium]|nr:hypothetical protein [Chloroflexota bacterium]
MARFIGLHSLPGFTREMLERSGEDAEANGVRILKVSGDESSGRVICEVEAADREGFVAWLNKINMPYDEVCKVDIEI